MIYESFVPKLGTWSELFKPFIESEKMDKIYAFLKEQKAKGKDITPDSKDTFRVFKELPREDLRIVWYLQDPYPSVIDGVKVASGIAMDCSNTGVIQPSLGLFWRAIHREVYQELGKLKRNPSLLPLVKEGIMFINTDLTCEVGKSSSHKGLWKEFQKYFIQEILNQYNPGLIYILSGDTSQELEEYIGVNNYVFKTEHPARAKRLEREWNTNGVFTEINNILLKNNNHRIPWIPELEQIIESCPF